MKTKVMRNYYSIKITQTVPLFDYDVSGSHYIKLGIFVKPKRDVERYARCIKRLLGSGVDVEVIKVPLFVD